MRVPAKSADILQIANLLPPLPLAFVARGLENSRRISM
jgi:hypothetical protein